MRSNMLPRSRPDELWRECNGVIIVWDEEKHLNYVRFADRKCRKWMDKCNKNICFLLHLSLVHFIAFQSLEYSTVGGNTVRVSP